MATLEGTPDWGEATVTGSGGAQDLGLLGKSASGDIEAYKELFDLHAEKLYNFVYYLTYSREESEDITQDTFVKVFDAIQGRDMTSFNFQSYLFRTSRNLSIDVIRRRKREGLTLEEAMDLQDPGLGADPERSALLAEQRSKVFKASEELTEDQQAALLLKELEGFRYDTIADVLDSNPNAIGALLSRARLKFREVYRMSYAQTEGVPDQCVSVTPLLSKYIDGEASPQESYMVESHLEDCPICGGNLESMKDASVTYRSIVPFLPLAAFKVWAGAKATLLGGGALTTAGAAAGTGAAGGGTAAGVAGGTGAAAAGAAATTAIVATTGIALSTKIVAVVVAAIAAVGIGTGAYFVATQVVFAKKTVPNVMNLKEEAAKQKIEASGLKCEAVQAHKDWPKTENEVVTQQAPQATTKQNGEEVPVKVDKGTIVTITLEDKDFAAARGIAEKQIGDANAKLQEIQGMGIDTGDLSGPMQTAQARHDNAKTTAELVGPTDSSTFWSNYVIQQCDAKKAVLLAQQSSIASQQPQANANSNNNSRGQVTNATAPQEILSSASQTQGSGHVGIELSSVTLAANSGEMTLYLTVANRDAQQPVQPSLRGYIVDDSGNQYKPWMYGPNMGGTLWVSSISDGYSQSGTLCFSVPPSKKQLRYVLEYCYDYDFNVQSILEFSIK